MENIEIIIAPTPNPNALKFILDRPVKDEGNSSYKTPIECAENKLASELFCVRGVDQIHFFDNVITITKFNYEEWSYMDPKIKDIIIKFLPAHKADYFDPDPEAERRRNLSPELAKIEEIFDKTIRGGLQADGGDIQTVSLDGDVLVIRYQGACGTCPSSTTGTLQAIKGILADEYNPNIEVYIAPDF